MRLVFAVAFTGLAVIALGQVTPVQTYNGTGRPLMVDVKARGAATIALYGPTGSSPIVEKAVNGGKQDLVKLFGDLWTTKKPTVIYAQLREDGKAKGPALVLQPMLNPAISKLATDGKTVTFEEDEDGPMFNGYRAYVEQVLVLDTSLGEMRFRMRPDCAPNTAWTIMELAKGGLYTNTIFHRVVAKRADGSPFVIQGGDPTGTGSGGPGFAYPLEKSTLPHDFGVISIARSTDPNTNGCQFFVCLSREGTKHLDGKYAAFGELLSGAETVRKIAAVRVGDQDRPKEPPVIRRAYLVNAAPRG